MDMLAESGYMMTLNESSWMIKTRKYENWEQMQVQQHVSTDGDQSGGHSDVVESLDSNLWHG